MQHTKRDTLTPNQPQQLNLFNPRSQNPHRNARHHNKRNPFNGMWLKAYVDALINSRPLSLTTTATRTQRKDVSCLT